MTPNTKFYFTWISADGKSTHIVGPYNFDDSEFKDNMEFVERYYGVRCKPFVIEE